jgi:WD40 repeat protein
VSPEASVAVAGTPDGRVLAWDLSATSQLFETAAHGAAVRAIAFDEFENHVVSVADDGSLWLGSARSGERLAAWETSGPIACCAATSRLAAIDSAYRQHALARAPVTIVLGTDTGAVHFINCAGLASRWQG